MDNTGKACIVCGVKLIDFGRMHGFLLQRCENCGLGVTENFQEQKGNYHRDKVYISGSSQFRNIFRRRVGLILQYLKKGKVLEIGSSTGVLLELLKNKGFDVLGIEPSINTADYANSKGIKTLKTTFEEAKLPNSSFDLVVVNHVLEHLYDPVSVLRKINSILKGEGCVFIDVPNFGGIKARVRGVNWEYLLPEEHKWHFTSSALKELLRRSGFEVVYMETRSGVWDYQNPILEMLQSLVGLKKRFFSNMFFLVPDFVISILGFGSGLTIIARKKNIL